MSTLSISDNQFNPHTEEALPTSRILVVDDEPSIRIILRAILEDEGYHIDEIDSGEKALEMINDDPPDLIMMDVVMPGISGYEVCREIRKNPEQQEIPIIFITSLSETSNLVEAFEAGANDYLIKPFNESEVRARVNNHLRLKIATDKLKRYSSNLEKLIEEGSRELVKAERQAAFGQLIQGIIHNLKGPLTAISAGIQTCIFSLKTPPFDETDEEAYAFCQSIAESLDTVQSGSKRLSTMVNSMMSRSRAESSGKYELTDLNRIIIDEINFLNADLNFKHKLRKEIKIADKPLKVKGVPSELAQVVNNLIRNAMDALHDHPDPFISIETNSSDNSVFFALSDNGPGIPRESINKIFDPLFTTKPKADNDLSGQNSPTGTGLGLYTCMRIIRSHQGKITVQSHPETGTTFRIDLPCP